LSFHPIAQLKNQSHITRLESSFFLHNYFRGMMKNNLNAGAIIQSAETILSLAEGTDQAG
jgi:hypothetical protein